MVGGVTKRVDKEDHKLTSSYRHTKITTFYRTAY